MTEGLVDTNRFDFSIEEAELVNDRVPTSPRENLPSNLLPGMDEGWLENIAAFSESTLATRAL
jgi:hypothetical protein